MAHAPAVAISPMLQIWVPGAVESANALWRRHPMSRHTRVKAVVAQVGGIAKVHALQRGVTFAPPVRMAFVMVRKRLFDEGDDLNFSLKAYRDGCMRALLPTSHDGIGSGNEFTYAQRLAHKSPEGVEITVTPLPRDAHITPQPEDRPHDTTDPAHAAPRLGVPRGR